jgi:tyrosine aminotransferase
MIATSNKAKRTSNPIRNIVDNLNPPKNHPKKILNLALGDPTVHGNLQTPKVMNDAVTEMLGKYTANGYIASVGLPEARKAIAQRDSLPGFPVLEDDIIIASGCSGALDLALTALLNEGLILDDGRVFSLVNDYF